MDNLRESLEGQGFVRLNGFFSRQDVKRVRTDAKCVFLNQLASHGLVSHADVDEHDFERGMTRYFSEDPEGFINFGKTCQHLINLHRLSICEEIVEQLITLGVKRPNICTRSVLYFNSRHLAKSEVYYKSPPHQDWRSMQGSLKVMVVWVPVADVARELGALEIIPGSRIWVLQDSCEGYRSTEGLSDQQYQSVEINAGDVLFVSACLVHRSGNNVTDSIRWSCHFRYNDSEKTTFVSRKYPNPYIYKPQQDLVAKDFPSIEELQNVFSGRAARTSS
jgi:phytanoyl-CoA hydroxylase